MLLTVERVAVLRHVDLFAATPDRVLAGVARVIDEVEFPAGATIMTQGALEDWMFIVVHGELHVSRPDREVTLGAGSVVGELAVLDPQPRSATVTALTPVRLFRLRKDAFDGALESRPEVARGIIVELVRRLRETHQPPPAS
ncbi:MAG: cyclic nucleotide-binding domain-containing protein [Nocardioidaceae bacterium]